MVLPYIEVGLPLGADQIQKFTVNLCSGGRQATDRWEQKRAKTWSRDQIWLKTSWWRCWLELMAAGWYWWPWTGVGAIGAAPMSSNIDPTAAACNAGANWKITGRRIWGAVRKLEGGGVSSDNGQPVSTDLKSCTRDISYDSRQPPCGDPPHFVQIVSYCWPNIQLLEYAIFLSSDQKWSPGFKRSVKWGKYGTHTMGVWAQLEYIFAIFEIRKQDKNLRKPN